jgi:hypothetical protein
MKKLLTTLIMAILLMGCASDGIKPAPTKPVKEAPYAELRGDTSLVVKTNVQVLSSSGEVVTIPLITKTEPKKGKGPEQLYVVTVTTNDIKPTLNPTNSPAITKLPEPLPPKKSWWECNKKKLLIYYAFSAASGLGIWKAWGKIFGKKKVKSQLVQTGNFGDRS